MRADHFVTEELLSELAMTPNALARMAAGINAKAGMEFEMYVPDVDNGEEDTEAEKDYDEDIRCNDIDDIIEFFGSNDHNDNYDLKILRRQLEEEYYTYVDDQKQHAWTMDSKEIVRDYLVNENLWDEEDEMSIALESMDLTDEEKSAAEAAGAEFSKRYSQAPDSDAWHNWQKDKKISDQSLEDKVEEILDDPSSRQYSEIYDSWSDDYTGDADQREWLRDAGHNSMADIESNFDINWPYWHYPSSGTRDMDAVAEIFSDMIGKPANAGSYHGGGRDDVSYAVEPDGSLDSPDSSGYSGVEFVSPPMSVPDLITDLKKVKAWADREGCHTNDSTGLHINVSVPNFDENKLDYVKLAVLLGDEYVLEKFGRLGNTYCKSGLAKVKNNIRTRSEEVPGFLDMMRNGLSDIASKVIHSGTTDKYTSINTKEGYIEFRSPGGDWLGSNFSKIEATLLRMVVALDAASDPDKSRQEYLKKLYLMLQPSSQADPLAYFARFVTGQMPRAALTSFIKQYHLEKSMSDKSTDAPFPDRQTPLRTGKQPMSGAGAKYWFNVTRTGSGTSIELVATSPAEAISKARQEWHVPGHTPNADFQAKPMRKYVEEPVEHKMWKMVDTSNDYIITQFSAPDLQAANRRAQQFGNDNADELSNTFWHVLPMDAELPAAPPPPPAPTQGPRTWKVNMRNGSYILVSAETPELAKEKALSGSNGQRVTAGGGFAYIQLAGGLS
jgi:hypothetical protein